MNRLSGLVAGLALFASGIAAGAASGCEGTTPAGFDEDAGGAAPMTTATLTIAFAGTGSGTVTIVSDADEAGTADGGATCSSACTEQYPTMASVNLTTNAADDSIFDGWTPDSCGDPLSMAVNVTCTATFQKLEDLDSGSEDAGAEDAGEDAALDAGSLDAGG